MNKCNGGSVIGHQPNTWALHTAGELSEPALSSRISAAGEFLQCRVQYS